MEHFADFIEQQLFQGDRVVHGVGGRYGGLTGPFYVHSFSRKMVRIAKDPYADNHYSTVPSTNLVKVPFSGDEWWGIRDTSVGDNQLP